MKGYTVYAKNSGVEIKAGKKAGKKESGNTKEGRVNIRFFTFGNGETKSLRFILTPVECYDIALKTAAIVKNGGKQYISHSFKREDGDEIITRMCLERWEKAEKTGYAYSIKRGDISINVPMDMTSFIFCGKLLETLAMEQAWMSYTATDTTAVTDTDTYDTTDTADIEGAVTDTDTYDTDDTADIKGAVTVTIEAVRKDGKGFKAANKWYKITDKTKVEAEVKKGAVVRLYSSGDFANAIYATVNK
jgi:hypothetical protein